jgi:hypothetical protein
VRKFGNEKALNRSGKVVGVESSIPRREERTLSSITMRKDVILMCKSGSEISVLVDVRRIANEQRSGHSCSKGRASVE